MRRPRFILLVFLAAFATGIAILLFLGRQDGAKIRVRYGEMTVALSSKDTNAILTLIAPQYRQEFDDLRLIRMESFAKPLGQGSKIVIVGNAATVWPGPNRYLCGVWPVG